VVAGSGLGACTMGEGDAVGGMNSAP
jgi:hypothetical protein